MEFNKLEKSEAFKDNKCNKILSGEQLHGCLAENQYTRDQLCYHMRE
jgi:hypothetical protein